MKNTIFVAIGYAITASLVLCIYFLVRKHQSLRDAEQYEGRVIGHESRRGSKGSTVYALKITYNDKTGATHTFVTKSASSPPSRSMGESVTVFHHSNQASPDVLVFEHLFLGYWIWLCVGLCIAGISFSPLILRLLYLR